MTGVVAPAVVDFMLATMVDLERPDSRVYFVRNPSSGAIKIGRTENLPARLATLRTAIPDLEFIGAIPGGKVAEGDLHASFAEERIAGEWFRPSRRLALAVAHLVVGAQ